MGTVYHYNRRNFLKMGTAVGAGLALSGINVSGSQGLTKAVPPNIKTTTIDPVRVGFVGIGSRGSTLVRNLLSMKGVELRAVCDIIEDRVARAQRWTEESGQPKPAGYSRSETDFKRLCDRDDLDLVINATPWEWHVPISLASMEAGKHTATEVPAATKMSELWQLVETSEKTKKYCVMLENVCYDRYAMMILNMVRRRLFGDLVHCETGYQHDIRHLRFDATGKFLWRGKRSVGRNGAIYTTHAVGPVSQWMNINRGDRFDHIVSMSTTSKALNLYAAKKLGADHPLATMKYTQGDINTSMIRTVNGLTVTLYFDSQLPRPYGRIFRVQGQKGIYMYNMEKIYVEGRSPKRASWEPIENYIEEFEHPLWKILGPVAKGKGHGGADYIMLYQLIHPLRTGKYPDMDVYDAAIWSSVALLSELSVSGKGRPVDFPDFTRNKWKTNPPLGIIES